MNALNLATIIICGVATIINLIVLGLNVKLFTEFAKERMHGQRQKGEPK